MWIRSKHLLVVILFVEKGNLDCLALGQISQWQLDCWGTDKKLIFFIDVYGKCPNLTCHNLTSEEAFEQIGKGTESESGKQTELLILLQILDSEEVFWIALDFLGKGCNK